MNKILLEVCCGSAEDVIHAKQGGADRVELNSSLFQGGLTPSIGELLVAKELSNIPVICMVRPRGGGFCYTDTEFRTIVQDCKELLHQGADGIVFGFLTKEGLVDKERCKRILDIIGDKSSVFHRAIDVVPNWHTALDQLIDLGMTRVLTSGQEPNAFFATATIKEMIEYAAGQIEILPGAGITLKNVARIVEETGCTQVHLGCGKIYIDSSTKNNRSIYYGGALYPSESEYAITDEEYVGQVCDILK